jgi:Outer membrane protein beta-barrel domain
MRILSYCCAAIVLCSTTPSFAQSISLEDLARRVEALERENAELKGQLARISGQAGTPPPAVIVTQAETRPSVPSDQDASPWEGPFLGFGVGLAESRYHYGSLDTTPDSRVKSTGPSFGLQLGNRWQSGKLVTGIELELTVPQDQEGLLSVGTATKRPFEIETTARLKGQLGLATGSILAYGIGGIQVSQIRYTTAAAAPRPPAMREGRSVGLVYGLGIATIISSRLSLELEATRVDFGLIPGSNTVSAGNDAITLRLNHKFP